jgi:hypothetical protein
VSEVVVPLDGCVRVQRDVAEHLQEVSVTVWRILCMVGGFVKFLDLLDNPKCVIKSI